MHFKKTKMGLGRELEGLEMVPTNPINFNSYVTHASNLFSNAVNYVKEHVVLQVEAKATIGVQAGVKTPFGSVGAGIITTDIGKVGVNTKGAYAKGGDGKGHNFAEANVKVLDKKLGVGGKVDYVNDSRCAKCSCCANVSDFAPATIIHKENKKRNPVDCGVFYVFKRYFIALIPEFSF